METVILSVVGVIFYVLGFGYMRGRISHNPIRHASYCALALRADGEYRYPSLAPDGCSNTFECRREGWWMAYVWPFLLAVYPLAATYRMARRVGEGAAERRAVEKLIAETARR